MENKKIFILCTLVISICILAGCFFIGFSCQKSYEANKLMTSAECAKYLRISEARLENIISNDKKAKIQMTIYDTYQFLPYMTLENEEKLFRRDLVDKWVEYKTFNALDI